MDPRRDVLVPDVPWVREGFHGDAGVRTHVPVRGDENA